MRQTVNNLECRVRNLHSSNHRNNLRRLNAYKTHARLDG